MAYKIEDIEGIGTVYAEKLEGAGVKTTDDLLDLSLIHKFRCRRS